MNVETYFEEQKGITVDGAINAGAKYTAIDICRFAKNYHESEVKNLDIQRVSNFVCPRCKSNKNTDYGSDLRECQNCGKTFKGK